MATGCIPEPGHMNLISLCISSTIYRSQFQPSFQLTWPHVHLGEISLAFCPYSRSAKVSGAPKIKRSKNWPFMGLVEKDMPEEGQSRQMYIGFTLSNRQSSCKSDIDKVKCTRKSIFTSYFLSCVQSHTFRRLSLGEWPQRGSANLLLNSKREKQSHKTYESKGNFTERLWSKWKGMRRFCGHIATSLLLFL